MVYFELGKADKKIVRQLLDKGKAEEFRRGMEMFDKIMADWRAVNDNHQANYHNLYLAIDKFDEHIAQRYDALGGSKYLFTLAMQLRDELLPMEDIEQLSPLPKAQLKYWANWDKS